MKNSAFENVLLGVAAGLELRAADYGVPPARICLNVSVLEPHGLANLLLLAQVCAPDDPWISECAEDLARRIAGTLPEIVTKDEGSFASVQPIAQVVADFSMAQVMRVLATMTGSMVRRHFVLGGCAELRRDCLVLRKATRAAEGRAIATEIYARHTGALDPLCRHLCRLSSDGGDALVFLYNESSLAA